MRTKPTNMLNKTFVSKLNELFSGSGLSLCLWYALAPTVRRRSTFFFQFFYQFCLEHSEYDFSDDSDFNDKSTFLTAFFIYVDNLTAIPSTYSFENFTHLDTPTLLTDLYEGDVSENVWDIVNVGDKYCVVDGSGSVLFNPLELEITDTTTTSFYLRTVHGVEGSEEQQ